MALDLEQRKGPKSGLSGRRRERPSEKLSGQNERRKGLRMRREMPARRMEQEG